MFMEEKMYPYFFFKLQFSFMYTHIHCTVYLPDGVFQVERPRAVVETTEDPLAPPVVDEDPQLLMEVPVAWAEPLSGAVLGAAAQPEAEDGDDPLPGELQLTHPHHQHTYPGTRVV